MLLNEFLKEHRTVQELKSAVAKQETTIAQQRRDLELAAFEQHKDFLATMPQEQKQIEALTATVQKVSDPVAFSKPASRLAANP